MIKLSKFTLFYVFLTTLFFLEGFGVPSIDHHLALLLLLTFPGLLILLQFKRKDSLNIPKSILLTWILFILLSLPSLLFTFNLLKASVGVLIFVNLFLLFVYVYNNRQILATFFEKFILFFPIGLILYSLVLNNILSSFWPNLLPTTSYQFVYARYGLHNHLGDLLGLSVLLALFKFLNEKKEFYGFFALLIFPFILFSYSRSAILSLLLSSIIIVIKFKTYLKTKKFYLGIISLFFVAIIAFFALTIKELSDSKNPYIFSKPLWTNRIEYARESLLSIFNHGVFGIGYNNFTYISKKYAPPPHNSSDSSHNLILDLIVELGLFAAIVFLFLVCLFIKNSNRNSFFFLLIYTLLLFQFDYIHRSYIFLSYFVILAGLCYNRFSKPEVKEEG